MKRLKTAAGAAVLTAGLFACGGGTPSGKTETAPAKDAAPPVFKGAVLAYSGAKGAVSLHWPLAADNATPADKLVYKVYVGAAADPGALAQSANLKATVTNKSGATVYDLPPGAYYCLVKAADEAGNQSLNTSTSSVNVLAADPVVAATPKVLGAMNVSVTQPDANKAVITGADAASIAANDFVVVNDPAGQSLKKVVSAKKAGQAVTLALKDAGLGEVVRSGNIESVSFMASLAGLPVQKLGGAAPGAANRQYKDPGGIFEITEYGVSDDPGAKAAKDMGKYNEVAALDNGITLGYSIGFEPELFTGSTFDPGRRGNTLTNVKVTAKGILNFSGKTLFELADAAPRDVTKRLLNRGIFMKYPVGAVPVEQETNLEVMAHLQLNPGAPLNMYAELATSKAVEIAFEWTRETGWRQVANDTFDQRITLNIMSEGKIVGTLELFPIISTRFFNAVHTGSYKIPKLDVNADVRIIPPPLEIGAFDTGVHVDSYIAANPKVFGFTVAEWEKNQKEIQSQKLAAQQPLVVAEAAPKGTVGTDVALDMKMAAKPAPAPVVEAKAPAAPAQKAVTVASSGEATVSFEDLAPSVVSTSQAPYVAVVTATGANFKNVKKVTFSLVRVKTGKKDGVYSWTKKGNLRGRPWDSKVIVNPDGTLTLKPIVTSKGDTTRQTTWTVTLTDRRGATTSKSFLVDYTSPSDVGAVAKAEPKESAPAETAQAAPTPKPAPKPVEAAEAPKPEPAPAAKPALASVKKAEAPKAAPKPAEKAEAPAPKPAPVEKTIALKPAPVVETKAPAAPTPKPTSAPVEKTEAPKPAPVVEAKTPAAPAPKPVPAPVQKAEAPKPTPIQKAEAAKPAPTPVEKTETPKPAPAPVAKPAPAPVEKAETPKPAPIPLQKTETPKPAPAPIQKAEAPTPKPAPVVEAKTPAAPAPKPAPMPTPAPVQKTEAPKPAPAPAPVQKAEAPKPVPAPVEKAEAQKPAPAPVAKPAPAPVEKAAAPAAAVAETGGPGIGVSGLMGGAIQKPLSVTGSVSAVIGTPGVPGAADGPMASAKFNYLHGITSDGQNLYITDQSNGTIRKVVIATGAVSTIAGAPGAPGSADGAGTAARFYLPEGITTDGANLYVADRNNSTIRKIVIATGAVSTLAGHVAIPGSADGTGADARFDEPNGITTDGKNLYVTDKKNHTIRAVSIATGKVTTLAGKAGERGGADGIGAAARFTSPAGITTDGKNLYVADLYSYIIRKIVIATGAVTTIAGKPGVSGTADGHGAAALFSGPSGITTDGANLYVTESLKNAVRKVVIATGAVTTLSGSEGAAAAFKTPKGITSDGTYLYIADYGSQTVKKIK